MKTIKQLAILLFVATISAGCAKQENSEQNFTGPTSTKSSDVSFNDICRYLTDAKDIISTKVCNEISIQPILNGKDTVMYLVNYEKGWELLSADRRAPVILAMAADGNITADDLASNPAEEDLYASLMEGMSALKADESIELENMTSTWDTIYPEEETVSTNELESWVLIGTDIVATDTTSRQNHLTKTKWGQGKVYTSSPTWNIYTPHTDSTKRYHCYSGCVPTAAAQILYYMNRKVSAPYQSYTSCSVSTYIKSGEDYVQISSSDITYSGLNPYVWNSMPLETSTSVTNSQYGWVSTLMVQLGKLYGARYYKDRTSASTSLTPAVFKSNYNLFCTYTDYDTDIIYEQIITNALPVMLSISYYTDNTRCGHCVIADGYMSRTNTIEKRYVWNSLQGPQYKTETSYEFEAYISINWGWDGTGMYSGTEPIWYNVDVINWTAGGHTFTNVDGMVCGFAKL